MFRQNMLGMKTLSIPNSTKIKKTKYTSSNAGQMKDKVIHNLMCEEGQSEKHTFSTRSRCNQGLQVNLSNLVPNVGYVLLTFDFKDSEGSIVTDYLMLHNGNGSSSQLFATTHNPDDFTNFSGYRKSTLAEYLNATSRFRNYSIRFVSDIIIFNIPSSNRFIKTSVTVQLFKKHVPEKIFVSEIKFMSKNYR